MDWKIKKAKRLNGELTVPADKSISHRAVMFGSIGKGKCRIDNFLSGEDCMRTFDAFRAMGVDIERDGDTVIVKGNGLKGLKAPEKDLYLGNSGTTMRIISGILAGQGFATTLTGDESLSKRPMKRIMEPLTLMGGKIEALEGGDHAPLRIEGTGRPLAPIDHKTPVASAQVKSCILAAGLYADGVTSVTEPFQSRDHTERMLEYFSADIKREGLKTEIKGLKELSPKDVKIPGDISGAAFFIVASLILGGSSIIIRNVGLNSTRRGLLDVLERMGAGIEILDVHDGLEPAGDLEVKSSALKGTTVEEAEVPLLIDEIPILVIAAAFAGGQTVIKGIKELKVKESDRIRAMTENLRGMGVTLEEKENSLIIHGGAEALEASELDSFADHRIAMSMAIAALTSDGECVIRNTACVDTSYPAFLSDLEKLIIR